MTRLLVALFWSLLLVGQPVLAAQVQVTGKDAAGTIRNFTVTTNTDITGNLVPNQVICDQAVGTTCATVTAGTALKVDNSAVSQPISAAALPLPTNAATSALQTTGNTTLATINTTLGTPFQAGGSIGNASFAATQATAANLNATVVGTGTFAVQAASTLVAETTKVIGTVRNLGNAGAITDFVGQAATAPANSWLVGATFFTTPTTLTNGQASPLQMDNAGNLLVNIKAGAGSGGTALADGATFTIGATSETPAACTYVSGGITVTSGKSSVLTCTAAGSLHTTVDNTNANGSATSTNSSPVVIASDQAAVTVKGGGASGSALVGNPNLVAGGNGTNAYTLLTGTDGRLSINSAQVNGVTVLTGTGATGTGAQRVTVSTDQATNAGAALVKGGVGVVNGGSRYQAVAASQTAAVLQSSTGATGDYLSHCVIYPASTSPGVVTVFDGSNSAANSAILFAGGATSVSNLAPIPVPVGSVSRNGAWEVTTGANVSVVCHGSFS